MDFLPLDFFALVLLPPFLMPNTPAGKTLCAGAKDPTFCEEELLRTGGFFVPPNKVERKEDISTI